MKTEFNPLVTILPDHMVNFDRHDYTDEELVRLAAREAYNRDEMTEEGYCAMKSLFYYIVGKLGGNWTPTEKDFEFMLNQLYQKAKNK